MQTIYTDRSDPIIDRAARAIGYTGHKIQLYADESITLQDTYWSEGGRTTYTIVHLPSGEIRPLPRFNPPQFGGPPQPIELPIPLDCAVIGHVIFRGKDLGLRFHVRPETLTPLLPANCNLEFSIPERALLSMTASLTSAGRKSERQSCNFPDELWEFTKAGLIKRGMLKKSGAITLEGRNAIGSYSRADQDYCNSMRKWNDANS